MTREKHRGCVHSFSRMVVFRLTNSSICFLASIVSKWCFLLVGRQKQATRNITHAHIYKNILFLPFWLPLSSLISLFHVSIKHACATSLGATAKQLFRKSNILALLFDVLTSWCDCSIEKHTEPSSGLCYVGS